MLFSTCSLHLPFHARKTYSALLELITADIINSSHIRRNRPGDRAKALELILPIVESGGKVASDVYCLCGRIYKDMFMSSGFADQGSRDQACYWYNREKAVFFFFFLLLLLIRVCSLFNILMPHLSPYLSAFLSNPPVLSFCYLSGMEKLLRRSRLFTRESTTWSS